MTTKNFFCKFYSKIHKYFIYKVQVNRNKDTFILIEVKVTSNKS